VRTILPKRSKYDWSELHARVASIHAEVRGEIGRSRDADRIRVIRHNIGIMFWLYLRIVIGFWAAGMLYVALS